MHTNSASHRGSVRFIKTRQGLVGLSQRTAGMDASSAPRPQHPGGDRSVPPVQAAGAGQAAGERSAGAVDPANAVGPL